jgi:hypothetical protein
MFPVNPFSSSASFAAMRGFLLFEGYEDPLLPGASVRPSYGFRVVWGFSHIR